MLAARARPFLMLAAMAKLFRRMLGCLESGKGIEAVGTVEYKAGVRAQEKVERKGKEVLTGRKRPIRQQLL